jgi:hypothetical protein
VEESRKLLSSSLTQGDRLMTSYVYYPRAGAGNTLAAGIQITDSGRVYPEPVPALQALVSSGFLQMVILPHVQSLLPDGQLAGLSLADALKVRNGQMDYVVPPESEIVPPSLNTEEALQQLNQGGNDDSTQSDPDPDQNDNSANDVPEGDNPPSDPAPGSADNSTDNDDLQEDPSNDETEDSPNAVSDPVESSENVTPEDPATEAEAPSLLPLSEIESFYASDMKAYAQKHADYHNVEIHIPTKGEALQAIKDNQWHLEEVAE